MNNVFKMVVVLVVGFVIGIVYVVDILKGKELVELYNCVVCYGVQLNKLINVEYLCFVGQYVDYFVWVMCQYQMGLMNLLFGCNNVIMQVQVQNLLVSDMKDIVFYIELLKEIDFVFKK